MKSQLRGLFPVGVTAFDDKGLVDENSLKRSLEFYLATGVNGIAHCLGGSEFFTLSDEERRHITRIVTETVGRRVPVMIGVAGVSAVHTVELAKYAEDCGADAVVTMPSYIRMPMSPEEIIEYYSALDQAVSIPIVIQNAAAPFGVPMSPEALTKLLTGMDHVDYIKEETRNSGHMISDTLRMAGDRCKGILGGGGGHHVLEEHRRGACGTMPYPHVPEIQSRIWNALEAGNAEEAKRLQYSLLPLFNLETRFGVVLCKEILRMRRVIATSRTRMPSPPHLDVIDFENLAMILAEIRDLLNPSYLP